MGDWPAPCVGPRGSVLGLEDLRSRPEREAEPEPLARGDALPFLAALEAGADFRDAFEELLRRLAPERADRLTQMAKQSRGAWLLLLAASGGEALVVGNALSGSVVPLAAFGFRVTLLDPSPERARFALACAERQVPGRVRALAGADAPELPFAERSFDLVVLEEGLGAERRGEGPALSECLRVSRGELLLMADNRFGYKRSSGRYEGFHVPGPLEYVRAALRPRSGERSLAGYRRLLRRADHGRARAYALYAHRLDFAQIVALDAELPALSVGPSERENRSKLLAHALGLFPLLAPSFAFVCARHELTGSPQRAQVLLRELAGRLGEGEPRLEQLVATRGNTAVVQTALRAAPESEPRGRWTLHVPMDQRHRAGLELHYRTLERVRRDFPRVPVPEPLFLGELAGLWLSCERRLAGMAAHQWARSRARADALLASAAGQLAELVVAPAESLGAADIERELEPRFELLARRLPEPTTRRALAAMRERARSELVGRSLPRVLAHGDLRAKHVQVDAEGRILGYLDWGTAAPAELPGLDLLHLLVHLRKQLDGMSEGAAWRLVLDPRSLGPGERKALALHRELLGMDEETQLALARLYPLFVGHTAETHWPHSRPGWFRRQFDL